MPYAMYRGLSDDDVASMVMFLRTVPAVEHRPGRLAVQHPPAARLRPAHRGRSLRPRAGRHGGVRGLPRRTRRALHGMPHALRPARDRFSRPISAVAGSNSTALGAPAWPPNITSHADGIGSYSDTDLAAMITQGKRPDGAPMLPPMPYGYLARNDRRRPRRDHPLPAQRAAAAGRLTRRVPHGALMPETPRPPAPSSR